MVFGCRHPEEDHIYQEEMQEMVRKGVLYQVHTAYSRLPGKPKVSPASPCLGYTVLPLGASSAPKWERQLHSLKC